MSAAPAPDPRDAAILQAQQALARAPRDAEAWHQLGLAWEHRGALDEAIRCYRRAVEINPRADGSHNNIANCLHVQGRFDEACAAWRAAIDVEPGGALYYRNLVQSTTLAADDPCFVSLERQVAQADGASPDHQADLFFAYGQALAGIGEPARGFACVVRANAACRAVTRYDEAAMLGLFERMSEVFTPDLVREKGGAGDPSASPVFVVGMPRSGSTLVEQILASHPGVYGAGECTGFAQILAHAASHGVPGVPGTFGLETLRDAPPASLRWLGSAYLRRIACAVEGGPYVRIVDKYLYNFINLGFIHLALPNARFIHTRRAPLETCLSIYSRRFQDVPFGYDLGELGRFYRAHDALMAHWRRVLPAGTLLEIEYEDVVGDLEGQVRRMLAHCGLDWDARCLEFHRTERQIGTASAVQVRQPLYATALRRWRPDAAALRPLLDGLGPQLARGA
ncbi:Tetratricopeptide TPR_1 repeat-containing protein [Burkholderia multivorans]